MRAALDNPEDARLRQAELEAARAGRERLMGTREREYGDVLPDLAVLSSEWSGETTRVPSRSPDEMVLDEIGIGASAKAALPRQTCRIHGCFRAQTSGHLICSYHLRLGSWTE